MKYRKCEICGMKSARKDGIKRFFMARFPLDELRCKKWVKITGNEDLAYMPIEKLHDLKFVCGKHFTDEDFKKKRTQLKKFAVPSIRLTAKPLSDDKLIGFPCYLFREQRAPTEVKRVLESIPSQSTEATKGSKAQTVDHDHNYGQELRLEALERTEKGLLDFKWCLIISCKNTSLESPDKIFVPLPKDDRMRRRWYRIAGREDIFDKRVGDEYVCEDHFNMTRDMVNYAEYHSGATKDIIMGDRVKPTLNTHQVHFFMKHKDVERPSSQFEHTYSRIAPQPNTDPQTSVLQNTETETTDSNIDLIDNNDQYCSDLEITEMDMTFDDFDATYNEEEEMVLDNGRDEAIWTNDGLMVSLKSNADVRTDDLCRVKEKEPITIEDDPPEAVQETVLEGDAETDADVYVPQLHKNLQCNECGGQIVGFRYTCVQCADVDLCGSCEAARAHPAHYVLRIPAPATYDHIQSVLNAVRKKLGIATDTIDDIDDSISIKSEVKEESDPLEALNEEGPECPQDENVPESDSWPETTDDPAPHEMQTQDILQDNPASHQTLRQDLQDNANPSYQTQSQNVLQHRPVSYLRHCPTLEIHPLKRKLSTDKDRTREDKNIGVLPVNVIQNVFHIQSTESLPMKKLIVSVPQRTRDDKNSGVLTPVNVVQNVSHIQSTDSLPMKKLIVSVPQKTREDKNSGVLTPVNVVQKVSHIQSTDSLPMKKLIVSVPRLNLKNLKQNKTFAVTSGNRTHRYVLSGTSQASISQKDRGLQNRRVYYDIYDP